LPPLRCGEKRITRPAQAPKPLLVIASDSPLSITADNNLFVLALDKQTMKKYLIILVLLASTIIFLASCKKFGKTYDLYFYTNIENSSGPLTLHIDDKNIGELPLLRTTLSTKNDTIISRAIHLKLRTGSYKIVAQDKQGNVKCTGVLKFRFNSFNGATCPGVLEHAMSGRILVTRIFFDNSEL
jgi:hypothetical protein